MPGNFTKEDILKWTEIFYNPDSELIHDISSNWINYKEVFIDQIAEFLYYDLLRIKDLFLYPIPFKNDFRKLTEEERSVWINYATEIPEKLKSLNLFINPYKNFCRTCLITDSEIEKLARMDHEKYCSSHKSQGWEFNEVFDPDRKTDPSLVPFNNLTEKRKRFYLELNYLIPVQLKKIGYEIIRTEEIKGLNENIVFKIAKAIHSRYLHEVRKNDPGKRKFSDDAGSLIEKEIVNNSFCDFDDLPDDIKYSNIDNAYHIPTKLLSIGYKIRPVKKGYKALVLHLNTEEIETMSVTEHIRWCWDKRLNGWTYGSVKDDINKTHPGLIPYNDLAESEQEKDRELVRLIPALLLDINYVAFPVNPELIKNISYAIKPQSSIQKILDETRKLNDQMRRLVSLTPEVEEMIRIRNKKVEEAIDEVRGSYDYAKHIQETFLPEDLFVRECFPGSFVLFKPKDIVSGDFYFFSKQDHLIIFAAADCTGHGIPGALLSTLGFGILDQAVNEIRLTEPSHILHHLYSKIHRFLRKDEEGTGISDDMDIALCTLDIRTNVLTYAGVKNSLYHISKGELVEYRANNLLESCIETGECSFASENIQLDTGDIIYLFSDGFADQFGGKYHKKYKSGRFKCFLQSIHEYSMPEQSERLYEEFEQWREENNEDQTDDILVIGIRV
jgi:serine phosphatase RsbU (regulator of sigma subunit)